jgi:deoxyribonucleoside regulator
MEDRSELLVRISHLYYKNDLTQQQIADQLNMSRPKVARLLQEARRTGIVRIEIMNKLPLEEEESYDLQRLFNLRRVIIVRTEETQAETLESIRRALASIIIDKLEHVSSIGFSYSQTIGNVADYIHIDNHACDVAVCDLMGAMMGYTVPYSSAGDVARQIGGTFYPISAPIMALEENGSETYLADPNLRKTMEVARNVELAIVGIGDSTTQNILYRSGYIGQETVNNMRRQGIVGEICIRFFDANGIRVKSEFESRVISVPWETLARAKDLIAVVTGSCKIQTALAALKTGIIKTLVTDHKTVREVLKLHRQFDFIEP